MDKIEFVINGETLVATKVPGRKVYAIKLDDKDNFDGTMQKSVIFIREGSIEYKSFNSMDIKEGKIKDPERNFSSVVIYDDGKIEFDSDIYRLFYKEAQIADKKVADIGDDEEFPYSIAKRLYDIQKASKKVLISKKGIDVLRSLLLNLKLNRLGFDTQASTLELPREYYVSCDLQAVIDELIPYFTFEGAQIADKLRVIDGFSRRDGKDVIFSEPSDDVIKQICTMLLPYRDNFLAEKESIDSEPAMVERKNEFIGQWGNPTDCYYTDNIQEMLARSDKEWAQYAEYMYLQGKRYLESINQSSTGIVMPELDEEPPRMGDGNSNVLRRYLEGVQAVAHIHIGLNPEVVEKVVVGKVEDLTQLNAIQYNSQMLELLNGKVRTAIDIENIFVIAINLRFLRQLASILDRNPDMMKSLEFSVRELINDSVDKIATRIGYIEKRKEQERDETNEKNHNSSSSGGPGEDGR